MFAAPRVAASPSALARLSGCKSKSAQLPLRRGTDMDAVYELSGLGPNAFENLVNFLALKTIGVGSTGFGPGPDGGRDGFFEGEAAYPSDVDRWKGVWYIQSKFHRPHLSKDPQKWLIEQVSNEIALFEEKKSPRVWPDNWIIATNIEPSGKAETGSFDAIRRLLKKSSGGKRVNLSIWGGRKIVDLLSIHQDAAGHFRHLITPGHVLSSLYEELADARASLEDIARYFIATQFSEHLYTKLDQAGSSSDVRPGVHDLFIDLPFRTSGGASGRGVLAELSKASAIPHRYSLRQEIPENWSAWGRQLRRARVALIKGGPGQGKSTIGQYFCQIHRAWLLLSIDGPRVNESLLNLARAVREASTSAGFWPESARIPIQIELKEFAHWYSKRDGQSVTVLSFLAEKVAKKVGSEVLVKTLKRALSKRSWIIVFDGLDEVPNDSKDSVANEIMEFLNDIIVEIDADALALCTSRPQGYSGQFSGVDGPVVDLVQLDPKAAMRCAVPLLKFGRTEDEAQVSIDTLESAIRSPSVKELMTSPLQSHIMAVVVRDGGRPPERRWQLFNSFYLVMKKRESLKNFPNPIIARLLREDDRLLKSVHMRLGFILHARAERSAGAQTTLSKGEFKNLVEDVVKELEDDGIYETVAAVMEATTERLVLVNTPENGEQVRFDIRQLQEFFAAEFIYAGVDTDELAARIEVIGGDAHWREVMHFLLSALIGNQRPTDVVRSVQVLRKLNEGEETDKSSLYPRRMGRACLIALRLLNEGVLDQDQRDRHYMRPLLDPIGGLLDLRMLRSFSSLRLSRSRQWLISLLVDKITTANPREYTGALALLGWMLPDRNMTADSSIVAFADSATVALINAPVDQQEVLFRHWAPRTGLNMHPRMLPDREKEAFPSSWVARIAFRKLRSEDWLSFRAGGVEDLIKICLERIDELPQIAQDEGLSPETFMAINTCMRLYGSGHNGVRGKGKATVDCGLLKGVVFPENWINGKIPKALIKVQAAAQVSLVGGLFRLMLACLRFGSERSTVALEGFVNLAATAGDARLCLVPDALLALVPIPNSYCASANRIAHLQDQQIGNIASFCTSLERVLDPPVCQMAITSVRKTPGEEHWRALALKLPGIAINFAFEGRELPWKGVVKFVPELVAAFEAHPHIAIRHILRWGILQEHQPLLLDRLKLQMSKVKPGEIDHEFWHLSDVSILPFKFDLRAECGVLRFLAPALVRWFRGPRAHEFPHSLKDFRDRSISKVLAKYGLVLDELKRLLADSGNGDEVKAGALALFWLVQAETENRSEDWSPDVKLESRRFSELATKESQSWFLFAFIQGVLMHASEISPDAREAITVILETTLDGIEPRDDLADLLETWRERSNAPVQSRQVLEKWLGYSFSPPTYASS
jgi:hypothetical protein